MALERTLHGLYLRQLSLGEGIDTDGISATYENGVLTVTIPVAEKAKPRRIDIAVTNDTKVVAGHVDAPQVTARPREACPTFIWNPSFPRPREGREATDSQRIGRERRASREPDTVDGVQNL